LYIHTQASLLGFLITFVNNFQFNLAVMFMYFINQSAVKKLYLFEATCFIIILDNNSFLLCGILLGLAGRGWLPAGRPDWAIFFQLGYFWRLIMIV
jgi:hypothetical protein